MSKRHRILAAWLTLAALLFAQAAQAALPCVSASASGPVMAFQTNDRDDDACGHETNPNACLTQCDDAAPPANPGDLAAAAAPLVPLLTVPQVPPVRLVYLCAAPGLRVAPDPPIPLRFCSFLN